MKHKKFTMIVALVLVVALAAGLGIWATGEEKLPTVTYYDGNDGNNARFAFTNTGKGSATDLFANFSNCMPGDSLTQTICVKADSANGAQGAKVYLRAEIDGDTSAKEGTAIKYDDVLSHIHMTVSQDGKVLATNKNASLFDQLDAADGLKSDVLVAEVFPKADPIKLDVTVEIDPAMGNAFQEAAAHIKFVFSAEDNELPPPPLERDNHDSYIAGYPDGTVAPNRPITRAEVAAIFYRILRDDGREEIWTTKCSTRMSRLRAGTPVRSPRSPTAASSPATRTAHSARSSTSPAQSSRRSRRCSSMRRRLRMMPSPISTTAGRATTSTARRSSA